MPSERLTAYLNGDRIGWFTRAAGGVTFDFDTDWHPAKPGIELSASMPRSLRHHQGTAPENFLWGLLPDNDAIIRRWALRFGVRANNPMAILARVGLDCAGAVQFSTDDTAALQSPGGIDPVSDQDIARHLRALRGDSADWTLPAEHEGRFSLPGAQAKFTLRRTQSGWGVPWGFEPSTHIVKPGIRGLDQQDVIEHLCLNAARRLGLNAAQTSIASFDDESAIVVERFDRAEAGGHLLRTHQEDLCQAAGIHPASKYQADGGPGIRAVSTLLRETIPGPRGRESVRRFLDACGYNWLISGTDAHAKNYTILYDGRPILAPLYDVASTLAYRELSQQKMKLAMSVAGRYRVSEIDAAHWRSQATEVGIDPESFLDRLRHMNEDMPDAFHDAAATLPTDRSSHARYLVDRIAERSARLAKDLNRPASRTTGPRRTPPSHQPRAGDLGATTHRGRYARTQHADSEVEP